MNATLALVMNMNEKNHIFVQRERANQISGGIMEVELYSMCSTFKKRWSFLSLEELRYWFKYHEKRDFVVNWGEKHLAIGFKPMMDDNDVEESVEDLEKAIEQSLRKFFRCYVCCKVKPKEEFDLQKMSFNIFICKKCDAIES
jgi:hypothetical protein